MARKAPVKDMKEAGGPLGFTDEIWITAPLERVWQLATKGAWLDRYFTTWCSGNLDEKGRILLSWGKESEHVEVLQARWEKSTTFRWVAYGVPYATRVTFKFAKKKRRVHVTVSETGWRRDAKGAESAMHHAMGWTHFLCGLKAFAQFGVELRA